MNKRAFTITELLVVIAIIGILILLFSTEWGVGINADSVVYVQAAHNLLNGMGLNTLSNSGNLTPMIRHAPLFPVSLSLIGVFGISLLSAARWLNAFLFGANILLVGLMINRYTRSISFSMLGSFLMLTSIDMLRIHSMAWTEPLFIFFTLLGLFLLALYIENQKILLFIASSSVIALAFLTRYAGIALVITGITGIFFLSEKIRYKRIVDSIVFAIVSLLPIVLWAVGYRCFNDNPANIRIIFHPVDQIKLVQALSTFSKWFLPAKVPSIVRDYFSLVAIQGILVLSILLLTRRLYKSDSTKPYFEKLPYLLAIFVFIYGVVLIISISFFDASIPLDSRILSPAYVSGLILVLCLAYKLVHPTKGMHISKIIFIMICVVFAGHYLLRATGWVRRAHNEGHGYASNAWKQSEVIQKVKILPSGIPIYTNASDAIYILTGKHAFKIPKKLYPKTGEVNASYLSEIIEMEKTLKNKGGVLVYLDRITKEYLPSKNELKKELPLRLLSIDADGAIYKIKQ